MDVARVDHSCGGMGGPGGPVGIDFTTRFGFVTRPRELAEIFFSIGPPNRSFTAQLTTPVHADCARTPSFYLSHPFISPVSIINLRART